MVEPLTATPWTKSWVRSWVNYLGMVGDHPWGFELISYLHALNFLVRASW